MLLLNVVQNKNKTFITVQNGEKAYRSRDLTATEVDFYVKDVVLAMLACATVTPFLNKAIPDAVELPRQLKHGIGLSDDHKKLILLKDGKETVLDEGPRYMVADSLKTHVGRAINEQRHITGNW